MSEKFGQGLASRLLYKKQTSGTTPIEAILGLHETPYASMQLITEDNVRSIAVVGSDQITGSTRTFVFANGAFTSNDVGGTIVITGASNAGNNNTFTIASVTNATTIVTTGGTPVTETLNSPGITATVTSAHLTGAWTFLASNDYASANWQGQLVTPGYWTDITAGFSPVPIAVVAPYPAASGSQWLELVSGARTVKAVFTPATKAGLVSVYAYGKGL